MNILDLFRNRPEKTVASFITLAVSAITFAMFQELKVETVGEFFNYISSESDHTKLWFTWGANLLSFALLIVVGMLWGKDVLNNNYMDEYPELGRIFSLIVGIIHISLSIIFFDYLVSDLLGIVLVCAIIFAVIYGDNSKS